MAQAGGGQQGDESTSMDFLWGTVFLVAVVLALWYFGKEYIIRFVFSYKLWQLEIAKYISPHAAALEPYLQSYKNYPDSLTFETFKFFMTEVGKFLRYPFAAILFAMAGYLFFGNTAARFNKIFTMDRLFDAERKDWPQINAISNVDLTKEPVDKGPWAMALSPMEFAKKYGLLREITEKITGTRVSERGERIKVEVIKNKAASVFAYQIGPEWDTVEKLPIYVRALLAAFIAKGIQDRTGSKNLLDQISLSAQKTGNLNFAGTDELLKKHINAKPLAKIMARHAYIYTLMPSMLEFARTDGVLASSDFLWLKVVDRRLWYILNCVGRQTPFSEIAGPYAHWLVEKSLQHRITTPMVGEAVTALELAIADILYTREE
jgi:intracellular multiplication protein IcmP